MNDDQGAALFDVADDAAVPPPSGGANLAKLELSLTARGVEAVDHALAEQARTAARSLDAALRGKNPAYAVAALMKPYHEVLCALGIGGVVAGTPTPAGDDGAAKILEAFGVGPAPVPDPGQP